MKTKALSLDLLKKLDVYWRAPNHLYAGQLYLKDKRQLACLDSTSTTV
jgi:phosphoketolase